MVFVFTDRIWERTSSHFLEWQMKEIRMAKTKNLSAEAIVNIATQSALDMKGLDVVVIDIQGRSSYADFLVIASGTSDRHVVSIAENIQHTMKNDHGHIAKGIEGTREGKWVLLDLGDVIVHVFHQFTREEYNLEEIWKEAPQRVVSDEPHAQAN